MIFSEHTQLLLAHFARKYTTSISAYNNIVIYSSVTLVLIGVDRAIRRNHTLGEPDISIPLIANLKVYILNILASLALLIVAIFLRVSRVFTKEASLVSQIGFLLKPKICSPIHSKAQNNKPIGVTTNTMSRLILPCAASTTAANIKESCTNSQISTDIKNKKMRITSILILEQQCLHHVLNK